MTKVSADERCECGGLLVPPQFATGITVRVPKGTDYVCLTCGRPYRWNENPPRLTRVPRVLDNARED